MVLIQKISQFDLNDNAILNQCFKNMTSIAIAFDAVVHTAMLFPMLLLFQNVKYTILYHYLHQNFVWIEKQFLDLRIIGYLYSPLMYA